MITTTAWGPRGFAAPFPTKSKFDEAEFQRIANLAKLKLEGAKEDLEEAEAAEAAEGERMEDDAEESAKENGAGAGVDGGAGSKKKKEKKKKTAEELVQIGFTCV